MDKITTVGIDLAKNVFSVHAVDEAGRVVLRKTVTRARLAAMVSQWPACLIGVEACSGAHEWARRFQAFGHTVRLMAARFVTPGVRSESCSITCALEERIDTLDRELAHLAAASETAKRLMTVPGIGPLTALATVATVGHAHEVSNCGLAGAGATAVEYRGQGAVGPNYEARGTHTCARSSFSARELRCRWQPVETTSSVAGRCR